MKMSQGTGSKGGAGGVGGALVVAGGDDAQGGGGDLDLGRAEDVAGGVEGDGDAAERDAARRRRTAWVAAAKASPRRMAMMSRVSRVARTAPWPGVAWSEWAWVISARGTGRTGSMWKPPGGQ